MSLIVTILLMLYGEINVAFSQIHIKHINTLCGQNVELFNVKHALYKQSLKLEKLRKGA